MTMFLLVRFAGKLERKRLPDPWQLQGELVQDTFTESGLIF